MSDNTTLNPGVAGDNIRTVDIGGVKYPVSFLALTNGTNVEGYIGSGDKLPIDLPTGAATLSEQQTQTGWLGDIHTEVSSTATKSSDISTTLNNLIKAEDATHSSGDNGIMSLVVRKDSGGTLAGSDGEYAPLQVDSSGNLRINVATALPTGANTVGTVGLAPQTSGGLSISRIISAASTNATNAKASAGQVFGWYITNTNASARYFKLYNKASSPTVGTDTPVITLLIPGNTAGAGSAEEYANGIGFGTGISYALTTGVADADTGAVAANEIVVNLFYK